MRKGNDPVKSDFIQKSPQKRFYQKVKEKILDPPKAANNHPVAVLEICILQAYISLNKFLGSLLTNEKHNF